jgi:hypothetical protein
MYKYSVFFRYSVNQPPNTNKAMKSLFVVVAAALSVASGNVLQKRGGVVSCRENAVNQFIDLVDQCLLLSTKELKAGCIETRYKQQSAAFNLCPEEPATAHPHNPIKQSCISNCESQHQLLFEQCNREQNLDKIVRCLNQRTYQLAQCYTVC